jgi:four helix bundle protein
MTGIERFNDLLAWQKARALTKSIYDTTRDGMFASDFGLKNQIQRASVSIMSNIAEGFERNRPTEFHQFLSIAKGSCAEVRSQLFVALDVGYIDEQKFNALMADADDVARLVSGLRASVQRRINASP